MLKNQLEPLYTLDYDCPISWPDEQESNIGADYPFTDYVEETIEEYVVQRYLEALWLPDSIACLISFIKSLRCIRIQPDLDPRQLFESCLLPSEAIREKYYVQLARVLQEEDRDRAAEEEIEETMMWFAYGNQKGRQDINTHERHEMADKQWLTKMEHREMKIQILLCFHILSLQKQNELKLLSDNGVLSTPTKKKAEASKRSHSRSSLSPQKPTFPPTESKSTERDDETKATNAKEKTAKSTPIDIEQRLELLMDRLSIMQLMGNLQTSTPALSGSSKQSSNSVAVFHFPNSQNTERDWMQTFCEDIVRPLFQDSLPTFYKLLHSKVFSHSPFSDDSDANAPASPIMRPRKKFKAKEVQPPSPLKLHEVTKPRNAFTRAASSISTSTSTSRGSGTRGLERQNSQRLPSPSSLPHRSRSVSVSVEEVRAKGASRGGVASSRTLFRGEVEMRKSSSKNGRLFQSNATFTKVNIEDQIHPLSQDFKARSSKRKGKEKEIKPLASEPKTLVLDTPVKKLFQTPPRAAAPSLFLVDERGPLGLPVSGKPEFDAGDEFEWSSDEYSSSWKKRTRTEPTPKVFVIDTPVKGCT